MENEVRSHIRTENAMQRETDKTKINMSVCVNDEDENNGIEDFFADKKNFEEEIIFNVIIQDTMRTMTKSEQKVVRKCLQGYTIREISREAGCREQNLYHVRKRLQKKLLGLYKNQLKYY